MGLVLTNAASAADPSLVGWWKCDETAGTAVSDSSGSNNNGTISGTVQWVTTGKIGGAWQANGSDAYIRVPDNASLDITNAITISMWLYTATTSGSHQLIEKGGTSGSAWYTAPYGIRMDSDRRIRLQWGNTP